MFLEHLQKNHPYVIEDIQKTQALNKDNDEKLGKILTDFMAQGLFKAKSGN
jgi:F0F1-type ATP synthase alpha subunit